MNYLILGVQNYSPNACATNESTGCGSNDGCYYIIPCPSKTGGGGGCPSANVHHPD